MSSTAAVVRTNPNPAETLVLDESSWNEEDVVTTREKGAAAEGGVKYRASKTLAERAAWDFVAKEKGLGWDLVTLNPPFVFGPFLHEVAKPEDLNTSAHTWYFAVVKGTLDNEALANNGYVLALRDLQEDDGTDEFAVAGHGWMYGTSRKRTSRRF